MSKTATAVLSAALVFAAAAPTQAQTLSRGERDRAMSALHGSSRAFLDIATTATPAQWNFKPAPESWSLGEIAEHLALSETFLAGLAKQALAAPSDPEALKEAAGQDQSILTQVPNREQKFKAPEPLSPKKTFADRKALIAAFKSARDANTAYIRETSDPLRAHVFKFPQPGAKPMDAFQIYLLIAAHTDRHINQMKEVMADPKFPR